MQRTYEVLGRTLEIHRADITRLAVDAIVSSENSDLVMDRADGPSVSGAIRRIEGEDMARDLARLGPIEPGRAVVTSARSLPCRYVIHAATVVRTEDGHHSTLDMLRDAVRSVMQLAAGLGLRSIAFPAFGVRAANVPRDEASQVMVEEIVNALKERTPLRRVVVALLDPESFLAFFEAAMRRVSQVSEPLRLRAQRAGDSIAWTFEDHEPVARTAVRPLAGPVETELRAQLARLRDAGQRRLLDPRRELEALGARVQTLLPAEVVARLTREAPRPVLLRLDEDLAAIPFELAWDGQQFLAERTAVGRLLVIQGDAALATQPPRGRRRLTGLLLPGAAADLPHAAREAERLLDLLWRRAGDRMELVFLGGERATRRAVLDALPRAELLHWWGHTRPGTAQGGGPRWELPTGEHIDGADLRDARLSARLVVANSCGRDDGLPFARAFLLAGARNVISTLWEVEDAPAERLALHLYEELALGKTLGEALSAARSALRQDDPLHWAAYVHWGDPRERVIEPVGITG